MFGKGFKRGRFSDVTNVILNYGYAILRSLIQRNLVMYGIEPCLGIHHKSINNYFNLSDDIIEKYDLSYKKDEPHNLPLFRESIKSLTKIKFNLHVTSENAINTFNHLSELADKNYQEYSQWFLEDFDSKYIQNNPGAIYHPLYLGAGSGVWTKVDLLKLKINLKKIFKNRV